MQYLSKAYNYYSGINPATLSGAIDVVVVRHNGDETLSSSPFHVRFGKLQVLRAGEKRVTLRLPNNLPPPHVAPFSMKVGEAGEAFFVLETEEDVPEELMTSPVVMATDASDLPPSPPPSDEGFFRPRPSEDGTADVPTPAGEHIPGTSLTQEPFGATEAMVDHQGHRARDNALGEVEPLDLDALPSFETQDGSGGMQASEAESASAASPSSILNTATSLLPSIPFLSTPSSSKSNSPEKDQDKVRQQEGEETSADSPTKRRSSGPSSQAQGDSNLPPTSEDPEKPYVSRTSPPPNPLEAAPDEPTRLPGRDHRLEHLNRRSTPAAEDAQSGLPKVRAGQGEGPEIVYGKDIVFDMSGYHEAGKATGERGQEKVEKGMKKEVAAVQAEERDREMERRASEGVAHGLDGPAPAPAAAHGPRMERAITLDSAQGIKSALIDTFINDLLLSAGPPVPPLSPTRPALPTSRATDSILHHSASTASIGTGPTTADGSPDPAAGGVAPTGVAVSISEPDLPTALASVSLNDEVTDLGLRAPRTPSPSLRRGERGVSEPPLSAAERKPFPTATAPDTGDLLASPVQLGSNQASDAAMDYAWDWGKIPAPSSGVVPIPPTRSVTDPASLSGFTQSAPERDLARHVIHVSPSTPESKLAAALHTAAEGEGETEVSGAMATLDERAGGKLKNVEEDPYRFVLEMEDGSSHTFELSLCGSEAYAPHGQASDEEQQAFLDNRITFQNFIEDPNVVDDSRLVIRYSLLHLTWTTGYRLLFALAMYRRSLTPPSLLSPSAILPPLADLGADAGAGGPARPSSGYGWSRWWRRGQSGATSTEPPRPEPRRHSAQAVIADPAHAGAAGAGATVGDLVHAGKEGMEGVEAEEGVPSGAESTTAPPPAVSIDTKLGDDEKKHYAKTLRLSSDQLKQLNLKPGPNTIQFSVTSSYSGFAVCTARIFLWEETDQVVISDIDGTITKSDALGHVFAAIGRDWTHVGIAKLYTDICNNGYKILYLTSRAIGQADTTREYLRTINQGDYRMPEGPVIMSPDRLMASLHREVIMRKPELFKMACLRDIQRLFGSHAKEAFFAGFGNRITDAMSYRSVAIPAAKIYTIDSTGVVKTELLQAAGHKGSYMGLNDLVNEVFPPVKTSFKPEFTDFNYWRPSIADIPIPDLSPPSPALSARSDESGRSRLSVLGKITGIARRSSRQPVLPTSNPTSPDRDRRSSRPSSPLIAPAMSADEMSDSYDEDEWEPRTRHSSMPGSFEDGSGEPGGFPDSWVRERARRAEERGEDEAERGEWSGGGGGGARMDQEQVGDRGDRRAMQEGGEEEREGEDVYDDEAIFDDDILAAGEMARVPF